MQLDPARQPVVARKRGPGEGSTAGAEGLALLQVSLDCSCSMLLLCLPGVHLAAGSLPITFPGFQKYLEPEAAMGALQICPDVAVMVARPSKPFSLWGCQQKSCSLVLGVPVPLKEGPVGAWPESSCPTPSPYRHHWAGHHWCPFLF